MNRSGTPAQTANAWPAPSSSRAPAPSPPPLSSPHGPSLCFGTATAGGLSKFLIDAGPVNSDTLLRIGEPGASADQSANPTTMQDVFVRIGGAGPGLATNSVVVNSDDVLIDHTWIWRADHGEGVGWDTNRADYGLRVNGDDVLTTGLFVEHFNKYDVLWSGERGRTVFFQNEKAYDAPNEAAITHDGIVGYAAYKVADTVNEHEAWALGSYCNYTSDDTIVQHHGFQVPVKPGIRMHHLMVISLGGKGQYRHVINDTGAPRQGRTPCPPRSRRSPDPRLIPYRRQAPGAGPSPPRPAGVLLCSGDAASDGRRPPAEVGSAQERRR